LGFIGRRAGDVVTELRRRLPIRVLLDAGFRIPGTSLRFGLDPILGLVPGFGDAAGAVLAGWILVEAVRLSASRATVLRIAGNVALDAALGAVPLIGDIFDFAWKANLRNVACWSGIWRRRSGPRAPIARSWLLVICGVSAMALGLLALGSWLTLWVLRALASREPQGAVVLATGDRTAGGGLREQALGRWGRRDRGLSQP